MGPGNRPDPIYIYIFELYIPAWDLHGFIHQNPSQVQGLHAASLMSAASLSLVDPFFWLPWGPPCFFFCGPSFFVEQKQNNPTKKCMNICQTIRFWAYRDQPLRFKQSFVNIQDSLIHLGYSVIITSIIWSDFHWAWQDLNPRALRFAILDRCWIFYL